MKSSVPVKISHSSRNISLADELSRIVSTRSHTSSISTIISTCNPYPKTTPKRRNTSLTHLHTRYLTCLYRSSNHFPFLVGNSSSNLPSILETERVACTSYRATMRLDSCLCLPKLVVHIRPCATVHYVAYRSPFHVREFPV